MKSLDINQNTEQCLKIPGRGGGGGGGGGPKFCGEFKQVIVIIIVVRKVE